MTTPRQPLELQVGGQLNPRKHLFVARQDIEDELYDKLARCEYCNILSSRQVGKSSVMMKTALRLQEDGVRVVTIDVAGELGTPETAADWYRGFLQKVVRDLKLDLNVDGWWNSQSGTANQRLMEFFRSQLFSEDDAAVVIFVDEVDSTLKLPYTDDFFTGIRTMYNQRASDPAFEKVAFCLIGVASPNELVKDRRTTSYNVGKTIEFRDFDIRRDDLSALVAALADVAQSGDELLRAVLDWTGGHPYLTLWFCQEIHKRRLTSAADVNSLAEESFASIHKVDSDVHFQQITRYLGERVTDQLAALRLYECILQGKTIRDTAAPTHIELKLSGIVRRDEHGNLAVRNRIYENIFNRQWVRQSTPRQTVRQLQRFAVAATILLLIGSGGFSYYRFVFVPAQQAQIFAQGLVNTVLVAEINAVPVLIDDMRAYRQWTDPLLREQLEQDSDEKRRLRASLALLEVDPGQVDYLWKQLLTNTTDEAPVISAVLARYAADDVKALTARIVTADDQGFISLAPTLENLANVRDALSEAMTVLREAATTVSAGPPHFELARRQANAGVLALRVGQAELARPMLALSPDPTTRSYLIERVNRLGVDPDLMGALLEEESIPSIRSAFLLGLGQSPSENISHQAADLVQRIYTEDSEPGPRAAAGWALRQWKKKLPTLTPSKGAPNDRKWYVNSQNMTLVLVPAGTFRMGSPEDEVGRFGDEGSVGDVTLSPFWLSDREVSVGQFEEFVKATNNQIEWEGEQEAFSPTREHPVQQVSWLDAARFCNWLSSEEGFKPYYDETNWQIVPGADGYRLPTEAEWEYACRATSTTQFSFGSELDIDQPTLLSSYAVYRVAVTKVCGSKMPNGWGLFDMHGNVYEWCHDWYAEYPPGPLTNPTGPNEETDSRVLRGGSFDDYSPLLLRSACRGRRFAPGYRYYFCGFRVSRTPCQSEV